MGVGTYPCDDILVWGVIDAGAQCGYTLVWELLVWGRIGVGSYRCGESSVWDIAVWGHSGVGTYQGKTRHSRLI